MDLQKIKEKLFDKRFLLVDDHLEQKHSDEFMERLFTLTLQNNNPVNVIIRTTGGLVGSGLNMYDALKSCPVETNGFVINRCHSTGLIVLAGCKNKRVGLPNSSYLFHSMRTKFAVLWPHPYGVSPEEQIKIKLNEGTGFYERMQKVLIESYRIDNVKFQNLCIDGEKANIGITPEKALELGVLTEIWDGTKEKWFWEQLLS